jgi:hypothetical protein
MIINDRSPYYILEGDTPVPVNDLLEWGRWFDDYHKRIVARTYLSRVGDELPTDDLLMRPADTTAMVSTVFLGTDHGYRWLTHVKSPPILFETMIEVDGAGFLAPQWRYATAAQARATHARIVEQAQGWLRSGRSLAAVESDEWVEDEEEDSQP